MVALGERLEYRQVMASRQLEHLDRAGRPRRSEQVRLPMEFAALELPDSGQQARTRHRRHRGRAQAPRRRRVEPQVAREERRRGHRGQIVQAADRQASADELVRQVGAPALPARAEHHCREMAAGRMAAADDAAAVEVIARRMAVQPCMRPQHLPDQRFHRHRGDERIVGDRHADAGFDQWRSQPREVRLVERAPIAAVQEHEERRSRRGRRKEVELLGRRVAVGDVAEHRGAAAHRGRLVGPAREDAGGVGDRRAGVVFAIEPGGIARRRRRGGSPFHRGHSMSWMCASAGLPSAPERHVESTL